MTRTAIAVASITGPVTRIAAVAISMSDRRLMTPVVPWKGVSQTATTGRPPTVSTRAWIRSYRKMSGRKKIDAVVSRSWSSSFRIRGCEAIGSAM